MNIYQMVAYETLRTLLGPWLELGFRIHAEGCENVPEEGGALLICNHRSILDPFALMTQIERQIHFIAGTQGFIFPMMRTLYHMTGMVRLSMRRGSGARGLDKAVQLLKDGELVGIFPEGINSFTRPDRATRISYFRTGFARIALEAGTPVIPAAVIPQEERKIPEVIPGFLSDNLMKSKEGPFSFFTYKSLLVRVGRPISLEGFKEEKLTKTTIDMLSGKLRRVVMKLYAGQDLDRFMTGAKPFDIYNERV